MYKREPTIYRLTFEEFEGLQVIVKACSTKKLMKMMRASGKGTPKGQPKSDADFDLMEQMFKDFADHLISWTLCDENGVPVPATLEGIESQDFDFSLRIIEEWTHAVAGVSDDLGKDSTTGKTFPEASIPMAMS